MIVKAVLVQELIAPQMVMLSTEKMLQGGVATLYTAQPLFRKYLR